MGAAGGLDRMARFAAARGLSLGGEDGGTTASLENPGRKSAGASSPSSDKSMISLVPSLCCPAGNVAFFLAFFVEAFASAVRAHSGVSLLGGFGVVVVVVVVVVVFDCC